MNRQPNTNETTDGEKVTSFLKSIRGKLLAWFLTLSLLPLIAVTTLSFLRARDAIRDQQFAKNTAIRDMKVKSVERQITGWTEDCLDVSSDPALAPKQAYCKRLSTLG
ncbi:MAG: hypothetical protein COZ06_22130 [Armatimonadetes bacterium CG_4_10_14_3_um_filter_66_18]|nr:hypothetical protein [Armatimonadota bacterium]OIP01172.1 MAG: hypothetical protein AUJ96_17805 [Armatimonadetes bacterium CG2_30_66_41]PIU94934.1 MAG: hypothetical protein COS65_04950 [Armatimonadetes bacterium CG06_land_8_20_14_3_00_66_21]PIX50075.1 MAG: hypothetical protein COZ57_00695 [Armatimonadetes bacterium CG_4_8_14_3_um_filter_66_20]PIY43732.1 MAG: hypothetical protein COZ06_22130 [Armatimonadetes bacterium CG_4_10_14_3_um_filter_66_18]PIZ31540.1 MAG: hypothetical protein COY42_32